MPYEDEPTPWSDAPEPPPEVDALARQVIGVLIEVHRHTGPGFLEQSYEEAIAIELSLCGIPFQRQVPVPIYYKGHEIGHGRLDFLIDDKLVLEIKACDCLLPVHKAQVIAYLKATGLKLALLVNFNVPVLKEGIKRIILS